MRISDWSSDACSSDLSRPPRPRARVRLQPRRGCPAHVGFDGGTFHAMINGVHTILYSADADATRTFLSEVLGWSSIDSGGGWLIFETPPTEMGIHPTKSAEGEVWARTQHNDIQTLGDAIEATTDEQKNSK